MTPSTTHSQVRSEVLLAVAFRPSELVKSAGSFHVTVLPEISPVPLAVRTLPGKVTLISKSVIMLALIPCELLPGMWKLHCLLDSSKLR